MKNLFYHEGISLTALAFCFTFGARINEILLQFILGRTRIGAYEIHSLSFTSATELLVIVAGSKCCDFCLKSGKSLTK